MFICLSPPSSSSLPRLSLARWKYFPSRKCCFFYSSISIWNFPVALLHLQLQLLCVFHVVRKFHENFKYLYPALKEFMRGRWGWQQTEMGEADKFIHKHTLCIVPSLLGIFQLNTLPPRRLLSLHMFFVFLIVWAWQFLIFIAIKHAIRASHKVYGCSPAHL